MLGQLSNLNDTVLHDPHILQCKIGFFCFITILNSLDTLKCCENEVVYASLLMK